MSTPGITQVVDEDPSASARRPRSNTVLVVMAVIVLTLPLAAILTSPGRAMSGCEVVTQPLTESAEFTPYELQRSKLPEVYLNPDGVPFDASGALLPISVDGLSLRWLESGGGVTAGYYDSEPIVDRPLSSFHADGGVLLAAEPVTDDMVFGENVLGERGTEVMIGEHPALLTWADPDRLGTRTHNLYWSDGELNYSLIADRPSHELINLARGLVCSGEL